MPLRAPPDKREEAAILSAIRAHYAHDHNIVTLFVILDRVIEESRRLRQERNELVDQLSYADLRASGGIVGAP